MQTIGLPYRPKRRLLKTLFYFCSFIFIVTGLTQNLNWKWLKPESVASCLRNVFKDPSQFAKSTAISDLLDSSFDGFRCEESCIWNSWFRIYFKIFIIQTIKNQNSVYISNSTFESLLIFFLTNTVSPEFA